MTTATHLRTIATRWTDLADALASTGTTTWPRAGRMSDYLNALDQADEELAEAARWQAAYNRQFLDRDPTQIGATRPPLRIAILDTMRTVEAALIHTADEVAHTVQREPLAFTRPGRSTAPRTRAHGTLGSCPRTVSAATPSPGPTSPTRAAGGTADGTPPRTPPWGS
ncbi:hypothetical protein [Streptomyces sp. NBC_01092]|uniref:hypothetical protein n=1 Tax=Streptomyces sp. NBC_01092 TaxID=2903748 RepID=UPI00386B9A68|nr:hypothetical protein OG254_08590 [Streptomyces sp. NBC_01092]